MHQNTRRKSKLGNHFNQQVIFKVNVGGCSQPWIKAGWANKKQPKVSARPAHVS